MWGDNGFRLCRQGKKTEPKARAWYEEDQDCVVRLCGLNVHEGNPWLAASPDGLKTAGNALVEIKCPTPATLKKYGSLEGLLASGKYDVSNLCKLTERMVLERLMLHLEGNSPLHPHQLGFRHGMSTQDILHMLRHQVLDAYSKVQRRTVVAVDVRKAFDAVPHEAVIQSAELAGGAVLSPIPFNLVMARLPPLLEAVPSLHFAVYADDVTIRATTRSAGEQEHTLQLGLDIMQGFLLNVGMTASPEKTEYVVVLNGPHRKTEAVRNEIALSMAGQMIRRKPSVRILGA
ncbi:hypothetical protein HPB47_003858 [Ixodes persulcatus]|uniref:Uncharacterized protein n=1 Tax=Ixodes persulcatus TaxID=34615 RepID=A0AC60PIN1_IXOPE|nr:hypothetical protein HPB47_003858 [Ixodes persulcatus]